MRTFTDEITYPDDARPRAIPAKVTDCAGKRIACPEDAVRMFLPMMDRDLETLCVMLLDEHRYVIAAFPVAIGTANMVTCEPKAIFVPALLAGAHAMLIAHNHPNGNPTPSVPDIQTTRLLEAGASILGITFVDHLVITPDGAYRSIAEFMERGF